MHTGWRSRPYPRGTIPETLPGERRAVAACGFVRQPLRGRAGQCGQRCDRLWGGVGVADVAGEVSVVLNFCLVPIPELQLDIHFYSRQDEPMLLFLHRC